MTWSWAGSGDAAWPLVVGPRGMFSHPSGCSMALSACPCVSHHVTIRLRLMTVSVQLRFSWGMPALLSAANSRAVLYFLTLPPPLDTSLPPYERR